MVINLRWRMVSIRKLGNVLIVFVLIVSGVLAMTNNMLAALLAIFFVIAGFMLRRQNNKYIAFFPANKVAGIIKQTLGLLKLEVHATANGFNVTKTNTKIVITEAIGVTLVTFHISLNASNREIYLKNIIVKYILNANMYALTEVDENVSIERS